MPDWITAIGDWLYTNTAGNLVASAITGTAVWLWARRKLVHLHRRLDHQDARLHAIHQATGGDRDASTGTNV